MKRILAGLSLTLSFSFLLASCGTGQTSAPTSAADPSRTEAAQANTEEHKSQTIELTDQNGRKVKVHYPVQRIVALQHHSFDILTQLGASDKIVGTEDNLEKDLGNYITDLVPNVKDIPRCGTLKEPNVERIAAQKPDLVLVAAQANPEAVKKLDEMGIPTLYITLRGEGKQEEAQNPRLSNADKAYTDGLEWVVKTYGKLLGKEELANQLWKFCMDSRKLVEDKVGSIPDAERVRVFIANPKNKTYGNDKYVGCQLLRAGAVNVAAQDVRGYADYNLEQLAKWNPDVIIVQDRYPEVYKMVTTDPQYQAFKAVQNKKVIVAPYWTKPWGNPDTDSIALGELWLAHQFYPDKITKEEVEKRAQEFYQTFYHSPFKGTIE